MEMIDDLNAKHGLPFKWVGCDAAFGSDVEFRNGLPYGVFVFADVRSNQLVYRSRPEWVVPPRRSKHGKAPVLPVPTIQPVPIEQVIADESVPWAEIIIAEGSKGPIYANVKYCRVIECIDGKDGKEVWLYIRKHSDGTVRPSLCDAPANLDIDELDRAASLRWPIEQSFEECKSELGMKDYETRDFTAWHRHMLLVMLAHLFVLEVRFSFLKKTILANLALS